MSVKSNYFKMDRDEFDEYLSELKNERCTIHILNDKYFYSVDTSVNNTVLSINRKIVEFNSIINSFSDFAKKQIVQSFLIEEIESTNKIEDIHSTRHDIFKIINNVSSSKDKKTVSIANAYKQMLENGGINILSNSDIRSLYDVVLKDSIDKDDLPDGEFYRINPVYITDGLFPIHTGAIGENTVNKMMDEFIQLYNSNTETITKMILCHFMFETIHPFYDGNGRLGRFLISNGLLLDNKSYYSFTISLAIEHEKEKYYKAFKEANDKYQFGSLNAFVETVLSILTNQIDELIKKFTLFKETSIGNDYNTDMTKSEKKIFSLLSEATVFSNFGVSSNEIMRETNISKRTLIYSLNNFKKQDILLETKIGKFSYYKLKETI